MTSVLSSDFTHTHDVDFVTFENCFIYTALAPIANGRIKNLEIKNMTGWLSRHLICFEEIIINW
jgi:hypothetical protein